MHRAGCWRVAVYVAAVALLVGPQTLVRADDVEERDYEIRVNDKPAGRSHLRIVKKGDGTEQVEASAQVKVQLLLFTAYSYQVASSETWKNGRLVALRCSATEDGRKTDVEATATGDELRLRINGKIGKNLHVDTWPSSYWKLADAKYHNKAVPILDSDTGKEYMGQLQYVGTEVLNVGAKADDCYHFRVTGVPVPIDLWFDAYHRLVRQTFTESGHPTIIQLYAVRR